MKTDGTGINDDLYGSGNPFMTIPTPEVPVSGNTANNKITADTNYMPPIPPQPISQKELAQMGLPHTPNEAPAMQPPQPVSQEEIARMSGQAINPPQPVSPAELAQLSSQPQPVSQEELAQMGLPHTPNEVPAMQPPQPVSQEELAQAAPQTEDGWLSTIGKSVKSIPGHIAESVGGIAEQLPGKAGQIGKDWADWGKKNLDNNKLNIPDDSWKAAVGSSIAGAGELLGAIGAGALAAMAAPEAAAGAGIITVGSLVTAGIFGILGYGKTYAETGSQRQSAISGFINTLMGFVPGASKALNMPARLAAGTAIMSGLGGAAPVVETGFNNWLEGKPIDWQKLGHEAKIGAMSGAVTGIMANGAHELIKARAEGSSETSQTPPQGAVADLQAGLDRMNAVDNEAQGEAASGAGVEKEGQAPPTDEQTATLRLEDKVRLMRENGYTQDDIDKMNHKEFNDTVAEVQKFEAMKQPQTPPLDETPEASATPEEPQTPEGKAEAEVADDQVAYKPEEKEPRNTPVYETQSYESPEAAGVDGEGEKVQNSAPTDKQKTTWPELESQLKALGYTNEELDGMSFRDAQAIVDSRQVEALGGKTQPKEGDFVKTKDGSTDFGQITPDIGQAIGRQSAPIRLEEGTDKYGKKHIEIADSGKRLERIKKEGYAGAGDFIHDIANNYTEIRQDYGNKLMLVKKNGKGKVSVIELVPHGDGDFYRVITGGIFKPQYIEKFAPLWDRRTTLPIKPELSNPLDTITPKDTQDVTAGRTEQSNATDSTLPHPTEPVKENQKPSIQEQVKNLGGDKEKNPLSNESGAVDVDKLLGVGKAIDVEKLKEHLDEIAAAGKEIKSIFAPASMSEEAARVAGSLRQRNAIMDRKKDIAVTASKDITDFFDKQPKEFNYQFIDDMELGKKQPVFGIDDSTLQDIADTYRKALDQRFERVNRLDPNAQISYMKNFFPHLYKDPEKAAKIIDEFLAKGRLEGSKSFFLPRKIPTLKFARELGLKMVSDNPNDMFLQRCFSMDKYIMAHEFMNEMKAKGLFKFIGAMERVPADHTALTPTFSSFLRSRSIN
ncbi:MAG: hypothetical protein HQK99_17610 [Nitrospirae bacterium]|nr:hypothetical protein [Nitrospirota bacterium]